MAEASPHEQGIPGAQLMGDLVRGGARWEVYLELAPDLEMRAVRGRVHFAQGERRRASAWIFLEATDRDVRERFLDFSSLELWSLVESLT
jgi:hypothetical protein